MVSVWPKQFSAKIPADTVSALLASFGHTAEIEFSAETANFGRKKLVSAKIFECHSVKLGLLIQGTTNLPKFEPKLWNKQTFSAENVHLCRKWLFRTKVHLRPKFWLQPNFGFFKAISYGYGLSEKIIFRSHTSYGHHTRQCWWLRWWWRWLGNGNRNSNPARRHYIIWGSHWHEHMNQAR